MSISFRNPRSQAQHIVELVAAHGTSRHERKREALIHGIGTERSVKEALERFASWLAEGRLGDLKAATLDLCNQYLLERSEEVRQSTLNGDRQALNRLLRVVLPYTEKLPFVRSEMETVLSSRAYTAEQVAAIMARQSERNALTTELAFKAGLRAHETFTLRPAAEQHRSTHRTWRDDLAVGKVDYVVWTVRGKGGLVRQVYLDKDLSDRVEARRLSSPLVVIDRGVRYTQHYDLAGGQAASQSFSSASQRALGWSTGLHGCRHAAIQADVQILRASGYSNREVLEIASQRAGHFRPEIIEVYLR